SSDLFFFFSSRRRHTRCGRDWSSDVCSSDPSRRRHRDADVTGVQTCALPIRSEEHTSELQSRPHLVCRIIRSEEHTSELQSRPHLVCRLLLEKKKNTYARTGTEYPSALPPHEGHRSTTE